MGATPTAIKSNIYNFLPIILSSNHLSIIISLYKISAVLWVQCPRQIHAARMYILQLYKSEINIIERELQLELPTTLCMCWRAFQ